MINVQIDVENGIKDLLAQAKEAGVNLTVPFTSIAKSWFKANKSIFSLQGPGQYPDYGGFHPDEVVRGGLTRQALYKNRKFKKFGFIYPMMRATGALEKSLTDPVDANSINLIVNQTSLYLGTRVEYAPYHQSDGPRTKIPLRPIVFTGAEQIAPTDVRNAYSRFTQIMADAIQQKLDKAAAS